MWQKIKYFFGFESKLEAEGFRVSPHNAKTKSIRIHCATSYDDSALIAKHIKAGEPIILDVSQIDEGQANRLIDFVCGSTFAINGHIQKLNDSFYVFSPESLPIYPLSQAQHESISQP